MTEQLGAMLVRLRQRKGYTQLGLASALCAASGMSSISREEVARWEREECRPSAFCLRWLGVVLEVSVTELEAWVEPMVLVNVGVRAVKDET